MRAIVRFSLDRDHGSRLRNRLLAKLRQWGFRRNPHVTSTYEATNIASIDLAAAMADFWSEVHQTQTTTRTHIDHFWMYADNPPVRR